ncbi:MAG: hypothetical protein SFU98_14385 [Leptospiraceae bacterium]|nr:hypothetical protein [Leptospiraceae bacterium]
MILLKLKIYLLTFTFLISCTNYSTSKSISIPPILTSVYKIPTGYLVTFRAVNAELFFLDYKLYIGANDNSARNPPDLNAGVGCTNRTILPNLPAEYSIEISPNTGDKATVNTGENGARVCKFQTTVTTGQFIAMRSTVLSFQPGQPTNVSFSLSSNALIVP